MKKKSCKIVNRTSVRISAMALAIIMALALAACGGTTPAPGAGGNGGNGGDTTAGPVVLRLGTTVNESDSFQVAAEKFTELINDRTGGAYQIEIFPNAVLGDERTMLEGMQMGTLDMGIITSGPFVNFVPEMGVLDMPFLFTNNEEAYQILDGEIGRSLLDSLQDSGLKGLAYAERGFRNLTNSNHPVTSAEDVLGLSIRVMENEVYIATFENLGVNTIPMAWGDTLTALQQGTIDGQENPVNVIYSHRFWESQTYVTMTRHAYASAIITMSLGVFNDLSPEVQQIFLDSAQDAAVYQRAWTAYHENRQMAELEANGMTVIHNPDIESFRAAVAGVYEMYSDRFGEKISLINAELGR